MKLLSLLCVLCAGLTLPAWAQDQAAGPNDTTRTPDYARHIGKTTNKKLSTGWTSGKGVRTSQTHDYYKHTKVGKTVHVHGYYHASHRH